MLRHYTLYNITNPDEVRAGGRAVVEAVGPLVYRERHVKLDPTWSGDGAEVSYVPWTTLHAGPELDAALLDAPITTPNLPLLGMVKTLQRKYARHPTLVGWILKRVVGWLDKEGRDRGTLMTRPVRELLWGYDDPLLDKAADWKWLPRTSVRLALEVNVTEAEARNSTLPDTVRTGLGGGDVGTLLRWQGAAAVDAWNHDCDGCAGPEPVGGAAGTQFPPLLDSCEGRGALSLWVPQAFRQLELECRGETEAFGVRLLRFADSPSAWQPSPRYFQPFAGMWNITHPYTLFNVPTSGGGDDPAAGDASGVAGDASDVEVVLPMLYLTRERYCGTDPAFAPGVDGVEACGAGAAAGDYMDVEPLTGITMGARQAFLLSTAVEPFPEIDPGVAGAVVPVLEVRVEGRISEPLAREFRDGLAPVAVVRGALATLAPGLAAGLALVAAVVLVPWPEPGRRGRRGGEGGEGGPGGGGERGGIPRRVARRARDVGGKWLSSTVDFGDRVRARMGRYLSRRRAARAGGGAAEPLLGTPPGGDVEQGGDAAPAAGSAGPAPGAGGAPPAPGQAPRAASGSPRGAGLASCFPRSASAAEDEGEEERWKMEEEVLIAVRDILRGGRAGGDPDGSGDDTPFGTPTSSRPATRAGHTRTHTQGSLEGVLEQ